MSPIRIAAISDLIFFQMNNTLSVMKKPMLTPGGPPTVAAGPVLVQGVHPQLLQPQLQQPQQQQLEQLPKNIIQTRELLYRLIISQLFYDGYQQVIILIRPPSPPRPYFLLPYRCWRPGSSQIKIKGSRSKLSSIFE
jgi:hypothetical protein